MPESNAPQGNGSAPDLSVILVVGGQRQRATRALKSILAQSLIDRMEILLFDVGPEGSPPLPGSDHPRVRFLRRSSDRLLSEARVEGVRLANAPAVCFMEEHCEMGPGCAELVVEAHRGPWAAVGGDFVNCNPNVGTSNQAFHMNYGAYVRPPASRGRIARVSGQNSTFKRDALLRYQDDLDAMMVSDLIMQLKMERDGYQFFYEPKATIAHRNETSLRSLAAGVFYWNWCFSNIRARLFGWSLLRRIVWITLSPLMPWVRLFRMSRWTLNNRAHPLGQFLRDIPFILAISYCSAAGQVVGLISGVEYAARKFSEFEMNEPRPSQAELGL